MIVWLNLYYEKKKRQKEVDIRHIPSNTLWPGKKFLNDDDIDFDKSKDKLKDNEKIEPKNNMELAIYHCRGKYQLFIWHSIIYHNLNNFILFIGRELKDTIVVAYLLEYYSRHATDCAGWMCTVSKAIPLLFKYNYGLFWFLFYFHSERICKIYNFIL